MKAITFDVQYWPKYEKPLERVTHGKLETALEHLTHLLRQEEVSGVQITVQKNHPIERGF